MTSLTTSSPSASPDTAVRVARRRRLTWMSRSASVRLGTAIVLLFAAIALISVFWTPFPPLAPATGPFNAAPGGGHLFGTDATGGDVFSRALAATHTDVGITLAVVGLALVVGTVWGSLIGFYGGRIDGLSLRFLQVLNAFPALLLAMLVISALGHGLVDVILVVALIPLPDYVRLARAEILTRKNWQFAEAAQMVGRRPAGVLFRHLVPNSTRPLIAYAGINASWVIATVGALGFVGLGIQPGSAEWGSMIAGGQSSIVDGSWWISFFPGIGIFLLAAACHLIGDGLSDDDLNRRGI
jgi:peptide/nickel transport system permease protein